MLRGPCFGLWALPQPGPSEPEAATSKLRGLSERTYNAQFSFGKCLRKRLPAIQTPTASRSQQSAGCSLKKPASVTPSRRTQYPIFRSQKSHKFGAKQQGFYGLSEHSELLGTLGTILPLPCSKMGPLQCRRGGMYAGASINLGGLPPCNTLVSGAKLESLPFT